MNFPTITEEQRFARLQFPQGKVRMVLDTDTYNEIDDQFAVIYSLLSGEKLQVEAFYAAPFHNEKSSGPTDGMQRSYDELLRIRDLMKLPEHPPIYKGAERYMPGASEPVMSDAARDLIRRALDSSPEEPLYVVAIGAITNVASAIVQEPSIINNIVVVWLGGHALNWPDTREFNLKQDPHAARIILDSGVPLVLVPCMGVATHLTTTLSELRDYVKDTGPVGSYLYHSFEETAADHKGHSRVIWDISTIACLLDERYVESDFVHSPLLTEEITWGHDTTRHIIRCVRFLHRDRIFKDLFDKLEQFGKRS
ncbi:nucleoside hydrolase [Xylanibacillus composti]|uniref:Inosine/uridine-preferring nucleoside hydrolase domain-containing protein n=1 Tax=Xylanibacillus composti TaxID=1572762 RepID=A0A8J4M3V6_9BACL|nr:nucleoside hydrolase [Xylanibacillus composti]MDT9724741.1 nucleoside hydrolase [Xylanibacillus composti]GIQ69906.1 hypothetical protein XYCOK13_27300 [Xylanibacillus composti]